MASVMNVKEDRFTTILPSGLSIIKISTDLDCQGVIEREDVYFRGYITIIQTLH